MRTLVKTKQNPFSSFPSIWDDFFGGASTDWFHSNMEKNAAAVNIKEDDKSFDVELAAPGMNKGDFKIELENNRLLISAERKSSNEKKDDNGNYTRREFNYHSFQRAFSLPEKLVNADKIKANYENGILYINIPKVDVSKQKNSKLIEIR